MRYKALDALVTVGTRKPALADDGTAQQMGATAFRSGRSLRDNPFIGVDGAGLQHHSWVAGFRKAEVAYADGGKQADEAHERRMTEIADANRRHLASLRARKAAETRKAKTLQAHA